MKGIEQKTGDAPVVRQGQTASTKHGSDPNMKAVGRPAVRDLNP